MSVVSSSDVSSLRSRWELPGPLKDAEQGILGGAQANPTQFVVVKPTDCSRRLTQVIAEAWRSRVFMVEGHGRCICRE